MNIDLRRVFQVSEDCLKSRVKLKGILRDLYPENKRDINVLLSVFESGIPTIIARQKSVNEMQYHNYVNRIVDEFGLQERFVQEGLDAWIIAFLGDEYLRKIRKQSFEEHKNPNIKPFIEKREKDNPFVPAIVEGNPDEYEVEELLKDRNKVVIIKYLGFPSNEMVLPNKINMRMVVGIGPDVFKSCKGVQKMIVPEGITFIANDAFRHCEDLEEIVLPNSLTTFGVPESYINSAKKYCRFPLQSNGNTIFVSTALKQIALPEGIEYLPFSTFRFCDELEDIILPNQLRRIGSSCFDRCKKLRCIEMPDSLKVIEAGAFSNCTSLERVILNEGLLEIRSNAFEKCPNLKEIIIPRSVKLIGDYIFGLGRTNLCIYCYPGTPSLDILRKQGYQIKDASKI